MQKEPTNRLHIRKGVHAIGHESLASLQREARDVQPSGDLHSRRHPAQGQTNNSRLWLLEVVEDGLLV